MKATFRIIMCLSVLMVSSSVLAQSKHAASSAVTSKDKKTTIITTPASARTAYADDNAGSTVIFSNLATAYPAGLYWCCQGSTVSGPNSLILVEWWHGAAFTPSVDATATKIAVSIGYLAGTRKNIILSLNADDAGVPGAVLEQWTVYDLGEAGTCCTVQTKRSSGISLTAGQQYWIVASTEPNSDVWAAWNQADSDQIDNSVNAGYTNQFGPAAWQSFTTNLNVAFAVYGQ
jgi:hypothetical protein